MARSLLPLVVAVVLLLSGQLSYAAKKHHNNAPKISEAPLRNLVETSFPRWDRDHNGSLSDNEINALIENPSVRGNEAAAVVVIRKHLNSFEDKNALSRDEVMSYISQEKVKKDYTHLSGFIRSVNRALFLPADPNLTTFHQGRLGDCYLLSTIGTFVYRDPRAVRSMLNPAGSMVTVNFASGRKIVVPPITDSELVLGARMGADHGVWLSVLEKAYAAIREEKKNRDSDKPSAADDAVTADLLSGGRCGPVIEQLTGHKSSSATLTKWLKEDEKKAVDRLHNLLSGLTRERLLITAATTHNRDIKLPRGIAHAHMYGVLGYDPAHRMVTVFNPWGNSFTPPAPTGRMNGYPTKHGIFAVPADDFIHLFTGIVYETAKPLH